MEVITVGTAIFSHLEDGRGRQPHTRRPPSPHETSGSGPQDWMGYICRRATWSQLFGHDHHELHKSAISRVKNIDFAVVTSHLRNAMKWPDLNLCNWRKHRHYRLCRLMFFWRLAEIQFSKVEIYFGISPTVWPVWHGKWLADDWTLSFTMLKQTWSPTIHTPWAPRLCRTEMRWWTETEGATQKEAAAVDGCRFSCSRALGLRYTDKVTRTMNI